MWKTTNKAHLELANDTDQLSHTEEAYSDNYDMVCKVEVAYLVGGSLEEDEGVKFIDNRREAISLSRVTLD